ncbi:MULTISPECIES: glycoside hydrolase family 3 N-terminal domain-containing protein [unclassified Leptolyngbya]|uniref:glycoside hydrolase family 3 N-terminal domain-containing protein n=1 Tax=unclassified Leptolyngbya TaxID=2650499 RepID=UPI001686A518|nr:MULTISPECIES: glycoside hydrolase family 3 N-terminal domain-containing protein [unclassified Leptolyngbya]MBD1909663.1 beta-glucosidase [Leptolyngbya sp. FACHB-8]MBD2157560.1 beta-glucosidase [Leptolyngbya sp. FACHB-16]
MVLLPPVDSLTLAEQVAQMVVVRASGHLFDHQIQYPAWEPPLATLQHWIKDLGVGGVIFLGGSVAELALRTQQLQDWAAVPLLMAADVEEGVGQRFSGATWFPPPMALGAIAHTNLPLAQQYAADMGAAIARESLAVGLNWVLAPVVDVNNNPKNPVINVRALGENPEVVGALAKAFIQGAQPYPVLTCAKHFPGHGDTATDSHLELPLIPHGRDRLNRLEWPPFRDAIAAHVDSVMSAHLLLPTLDEHYPATLSPRILTGELRQGMGFEGLIVTDALVMGAITNRYGANEAPVLAVEAGVDILLMPVDPEGAINAVIEAVECGRITPERIRESVERIWQAKHKIAQTRVSGDAGHAWENLAPPGLEAQALTEQLYQPEAIATAQNILHASMQVHQPQSSFQMAPGSRNLIVMDDALRGDGLTHQSPAIALPRQWGCSLQICDRYNANSPGSDHPPTLLQLFIRGNPFRGSAGLSETAQTWLEALLQAERLEGLMIYGSPYILHAFRARLPESVPYVFTFGQTDVAQAIALQALTGDAQTDASSWGVTVEGQLGRFSTR